MPNIIANPDIYDFIVLGGVQSPGVVVLSGHDRKIGWDVKKGPGQSGATTTRTSEDPIEFTATFSLLVDDVLGFNDFEAWDSFVEVIKSTVNGKTPKALDAYHPDLAANDITSVVLSSLGGFQYDGKGGATIAVKFLEYRPAKDKGGTPKGSKTASKVKPRGPDPDQALLDDLAKVTNQYQETPWR